jgi:DNA repair protein RecN (Recombination protein N)
VHAADLTAARCAAAPALARAVEERLAGLGLPGAELVVDVRTATDWVGLTPAGADTVEFLVAPNAGLPARSLARTASGGELSRILLALKTVLAGVESRETLVFDEIDAGIGGLTATAVGHTLADLSETTQVVVVTHLAQVAAFAERHYRIEKVDVAGEGAVTRLVALEDDHAVLAELSRMMGGEAGDPGALAHARALRERAAGAAE